MKFASLLVALFVSLCASAGVFYYQVNPVDENGQALTTPYAYLSVRDMNTDTVLESSIGSADLSTTKVVPNLFNEELVAILPDSYGWSTDDYFIFELYNASNEMVYYKTVAAADLAEFTDWTSLSAPYTVSGFMAVPEPTSGLLLMVGVGLLALRRRRIFNESSKI